MTHPAFHTDPVLGESPHIPHRPSPWGLISHSTQTQSLGTHLTFHTDPVLGDTHRPSPWRHTVPVLGDSHRPSLWGLTSHSTQTQSLGTHLTFHTDPVLGDTAEHETLEVIAAGTQLTVHTAAFLVTQPAEVVILTALSRTVTHSRSLRLTGQVSENGQKCREGRP